MSFVIFNIETNKVYKKFGGIRTFATTRSAKGMSTRLNNGEGLSRLPWHVITLEEYKSQPTKTHLVKNLMTGKMVEEPIDTPWRCSVASESYWSS